MFKYKGEQKVSKTAETYTHTHTHTHTRVVLPGLFLLIFNFCACAESNDLNRAIQNATAACSGIGDSMADLKKMTGINTVVTAVGTVAGGVALGTGVAKASVDKEQQELEAKVAKLISEKSNVPIQELEIENEQEFRTAIHNVAYSDVQVISDDIKKIDELEQKSKTLGNVRTGAMATSTVTNIAGTTIAASNKVDDDLESRINRCVAAIKNLSSAKLEAKVENTATHAEIERAEKIISSCRDYEYVDVKPINKRATGAAIASGIGIGTGVVGTITSAVANTDATRKGDEQKEKNLNTAANVMSGASTAASATATIFNATQISAIKKVATVAEACEEALR